MCLCHMTTYNAVYVCPLTIYNHMYLCHISYDDIESYAFMLYIHQGIKVWACDITCVDAIYMTCVDVIYMYVT